MDEISKYPSELAERFQIRMPEGLRDKIREAAEKNNRSMNAEIVSRLESSFNSIMTQIVEANRDNPMNHLQEAIVANADEMRRTRELVEELLNETRGKGAKDV